MASMLECDPKMKSTDDQRLEKADEIKSTKKDYESKSILELVEELEAAIDSLEAVVEFSWPRENEKTTTKQQPKLCVRDPRMHGQCGGEPITQNVDGSYPYMGVSPGSATLLMNIYSTGPRTIGGSRAPPLDPMPAEAPTSSDVGCEI